MDLSFSDMALIASTLAGPALAVQVQKIVEHAKAVKERQGNIFRTLMSTRATRLSLEHVQALNLIELDFGGGGKRQRSVVSAYRVYFDHLSDPTNFSTEAADQKRVAERRTDLFVDLLASMATALGLTFDRVQLMRGAYQPVDHVDAETAIRELRKSLVAVLSGQQTLSMRVTSFPFDQQSSL